LDTDITLFVNPTKLYSCPLITAYFRQLLQHYPRNVGCSVIGRCFDDRNEN